MSDPLFLLNKQVRKKSSRDLIGIVLKHTGIRQKVHWYKVNFNGRIIACPEHDLEAFSGDLDVETEFKEGNFGSKRSFSKLITYKKLTTSIRNNIYSLFASKTEFHAYQYKPLLKFLDSPDQRLLIADEVGLGKTIESGLILIEQRARNPVSRILIVCPSSLTKKWRDEMKVRFDEEFEIMDARRVREFLDDYTRDGDKLRLRGICSLPTLRNRQILKNLDEISPSFDLVIIDEAHHLKNPKTLSNRLARILSTMTDGMIFLTATPIHLGSVDLFNLLRLLRPEDYENFGLFQRRLTINRQIINAERAIIKNPPKIDECLEQLRSLTNTEERERFEKHPIYKDIIFRLENQDLNNRRALIEMQRDINSLNMTSSILTRTRKREVQKIAQRNAQIISHDFSEEEKRFYDAVTAYVRSKFQKYGYSGIEVFVAMNYQRQVASCISAMVEYYKEKFKIKLDSYVEEVIESTDFEIEDWLSNSNDHEEKNNDHDELIELINSCNIAEGLDSKYDKFLEQIHLLEKAESGRKILVFSYFRKTLNYLSKRLSEDGFKNVVIHGGYEPSDRHEIIEQFREDPTVRIMLSSEVGSEGLDFQFCHIMVNYDLPWNPMKVEQRIGRIDRFGQKSDRIIIINMVTNNTIEEKILSRLYDRIEIFKESIGDLEPILGEQIHNLTLDLLTSSLSEDEENERIQQITDAIENERQQQEKLEKESSKLIGFDEYFEQEFLRITKYKNYISADELKTFWEEFLVIEFPNVKLRPQKNPHVYKLPLPQDLFNKIRESISQEDPSLRNFITAYYNQNKNVLITFNSEEANKDKTLEFINLNHPIIQMIVKHYDFKKTELHPVSKIQVEYNNLPAGYYFYFIYLVEFTGARQEKRLENIVIKVQNFEVLSSEGSDELIGIAKVDGFDLQYIEPFVYDKFDDAFDIATETIHKMRETREEELKRINESLIVERIASLRKSFDFKISKAQSRLDKAKAKQSDYRIIRMTEVQIRNLIDEKELKIREIEKRRQVSSFLEEVAAGVIKI